MIICTAIWLTKWLHQTAIGTTVFFTDDDILWNVNETTCEVTRVCSTKRGVSKTLTRTVRRDEVFKNGQTFTEVALDWARNNLTLRVSYKTTHTCNLTNLKHVASSARVDHHPNWVGCWEVCSHCFCYLVGGFSPDFNKFLLALWVSDQTAFVLLLNLLSFFFSFSK